MPEPKKAVRLRRPTTHYGEKLAAGAQITVDESRARWLIEQGAADPVGWEYTGQRMRAAAPISAPAPNGEVPARRKCCGSR